MTFSTRWLKTPATVLRRTDTGERDQLNRPVVRWDPIGRVMTNKQQVAAREVTTGAGTTETVDWLIFVEPTADVRPRDQLRFDDGDYQVQSVDAPSRPGRPPHHLEVLANRVS